MNRAEPLQRSCSGAKSRKGSEQSYRKEEAAPPQGRLVSHFFPITKAEWWEEQLPSPYYYLQIFQALLFQEQLHTGISQD